MANNNTRYHSLVLQSVPPSCGSALDVGCGEGDLTHLLATRSHEVIGIDVSSEILSEPRRQNLQFISGDAMIYPFPPAFFDFITAVATLHHLPLEAGLERLQTLLKPGGVLTIIGLYRLTTLTDFAFAAMASPLSWLLRGVHRPLPMRAPMQTPTHTLAEIQSATKRLLPGAILKRRLFFRYSIIWTKPS